MLNRCCFIGNLGKDSELKFMPSGDGVASFSIACTEKYKDKNGSKQEKTELINCTIYGKRAEALHQYLNKGQRIYVEGKFRTRKWADKDGTDRYFSFISCDDIKLLGSSKNIDTQPATQENNTLETDDFDDDIPF